MKKIIVLMLSLLMLFSVAGCTETYLPTGGGGTDHPTGGGGDGGNGNPQGQPFTVSLILDDGGTLPSFEDVFAVWSNKSATYTAPFNEQGIATSYEPDGDYRVTISGDVEGYTYDPNLYVANNRQKNVNIDLLPIRQMTGTGGASDATCYVLPGTGTYRFNFTKVEEQLYFVFHPNSRGTYRFRSLIDATANELNATLYSHAIQFLNQQNITSVDLSSSGSYTKNFTTDVEVAQDELGGARYYSLKLHSSVSKPAVKYVDVRLEKIGDYVRPDLWTDVPVPEVKDFTLPSTGTFTFIASTNGKVLNQNMVGETDAGGAFHGYVGEDGYYHVGSVTGPVLYAQLNQDLSPYLSTSSGLGLNHPEVRKTCGNVYLDYSDFFSAHIAKCQGERGLVPVTPALKEFLYNFSVSNQYFWDGASPAEEAGYVSNEESQWLFACGYFL